jgi:hypothetical protein
MGRAGRDEIERTLHRGKRGTVAMRSNGLFLIAESAAREVDEPLVTRYRDALVLGALREDVMFVPGIRKVIEHLSFSHFWKPPLPGGFLPLVWPGPRLKANRFFDRALAEHRRGNIAAGFVQLGRVVHLVADMSCPVHAHRVIHDGDPYEWWVEANTKTLRDLPIPHEKVARKVPIERASEAIEGMARQTQPFRPDRTNHHAGRLLRRLGILRPVRSAEAGAQARLLVPLAIAWTTALLRLYLTRIRTARPSPIILN